MTSMTRRVRQTAWLVLGIGLVVCSSRAWSYRQANAATSAQAREAAGLADDVRHEVVTLRNVMQEATVVGRATDWVTQVDQPLAAVKERLEAWRDREAHAGAKVQIETALGELGALQQNALQAHDFLDNNQRALANEVVLADGAQLSNALYGRLAEAKRLSVEALERSAAQSARTEASLIIALVALGALGFLALAPVVFRQDAVFRQEAPSPAVRSDMPSMESFGDASASSQSVASDVAATWESRTSMAGDTTAAVTVTPAVAPAAMATDPGPISEVAAEEVEHTRRLAELARLCTEFARVKDRQELEGLLDRAMQLLDARGLIVWHPVGDRALRPALARGYGSKTLARIPEMPLGDGGVFAGAFRSGELRVIVGRAGDFGALVLPMLAAEGCLGLVTLELRAGETSELVQALARILVAQLATLVAPEPAVASTSDAAAAVTNSVG